jgi:integrase/recombinase XerD
VAPYTVSGLEAAIRDQSENLGFHFSAHSFRRTFGRELYFAGMPLPEIQFIYGHSTLEMTIKYIGIRDSDVDASIEKYQPRYI